MTTAVLLDHVSAYAAAVRSHLADLPSEQVEDLTDGLEADLVEALEDREGPVVTGEIPIWQAAGAGIPTAPAGAATMIDLAHRFGPAQAYAAELRAAAGLEPAGPTTPARPRRLRGRLAWRMGATRTRVLELASGARQAVAPVLATPLGRRVVTSLVALRPLWWVVRGWVWYVLGASVLWARYRPLGFYLPIHVGAWLLLAALVVLSIATGRGLGGQRRWVRGGFAALNVIAVLALPTTLSNFDNELRRELLSGGTEYVEVPVYEQVPVVDGVYVDGMLVSNLFVYDAEGDPLERVQIFDDRGRPVRTTYDDGTGAWSLPGVVDPWVFSPDTTVDGRARWNVYPLLGVPHGEMGDAGDGVEPSDPQPRTPPLPFAQAPALVGAADAGAATEAGATAGATGNATG